MLTYSGIHKFQALLWGGMVIIIIAVISVVVYTNTTLRSVEKNLPNTLLTELNALDLVLVDMSQVLSAARIATSHSDAANLDMLRERVEVVSGHITELRNTYVTDNLVNASAFHAVVAPVVADLQIWLAEGVSGYGPNSTVTLAIVDERISVAFSKMQTLKIDSQLKAQGILNEQRDRIEQFLFSTNLLLASVFIIVCCVVFLLIHQFVLQHRERIVKNELQYQRDLFDTLLQNLLLGVTVWDKEGVLLHVNKSFTDITGYCRDEIGCLKDWPGLAYPDAAYREQVSKEWKAAVQRDAVSEFKVTCKNGDIKDIEFRAMFLPDSRMLVTLSDVTARNRDELALQESRKIKARSRKMESLGLLAGGVAHDLNNILSGIVSYPELILMDLPADHKLRRPIEVMCDSGHKATAIVQDLLTVARGVAIAKAPLNINTIIRDYLESPEFNLVQKHHPGITLNLSLQESLFNIRGSHVHIRKILMNLVSNAYEATGGSGTITLSTANSYIDTPVRGYDDIREGEYVVLSVADQGKGIPAGDLNRIFEPFYSKKVMGRSGTGLGLAVVWNAVQDHDGYINVESADSGTTFDILFPVTRESVQDLGLIMNIEEYRGNGELILIVDDVETQREISSGMLTKLGYKVESVASGELAVEFIREHRVDLVFLDMIMDPGMNGRQTYEKILAINPSQKAIIASGFAETDDVKETLRLGVGQYLKKPLTIQELGLAVYKELHTVQ